MSEEPPRTTWTQRRAQARRTSTMKRFEQVSDTSSFHAGSTMFAGLLLYGGVGWLLDRWLGTGWLLPVGILVGAGLSFWTLWLRYGVVRQVPPPQEPEQADTAENGRTDHRPI